MKARNLLPVLLSSFVALSLSACQSPKTQVKPLSPELNQALQLKPGMQITLELSKPTTQSWFSPTRNKRLITLDHLSASEGLSFFWREDREEKITEANSAPSETGETNLEPQGQLSLPNFFQARQMALPVFWPSGEMYLSQNSGLWLSDVAFQELQQNGETQWKPGLLENPLVGPLQEIPALEKQIQSLGSALSSKQIPMDSLRRIGKVDYPLVINGKPLTVPAVQAESWLGRYLILDHPTHPLIVEFKLAPQASIADWLWTPLGLIRNVVEYKVIEIKTM